MKNRIGIIGGSGFVGFSLAKHLSSLFNVKILDIEKPLKMPDNMTFEYCDIREYATVKKALANTDLVIHTAIVQIPLINCNKKLAYEVNFLGTTNICRAVEENAKVRGMLLSGTWHTIGERELKGLINEEFGFRPDKVENRARLYALSKMAQEAIVRFYSEMSTKTYGVIRMGTVLGNGMPEKTAANIFITKGLKGNPITPYKSSMYRPMLYVDISDVCRAYEHFALKIVNGGLEKTNNSLSEIVNVYYPEPITIFELAKITKQLISNNTDGKIEPKIEIVDNGTPQLFNEEDKNNLRIDMKKAKILLNLEKFISPKEALEKLVKTRLFTKKH